MFENITNFSQKEIIALIKTTSKKNKIFGYIMSGIILVCGLVMFTTDLVEGIVFTVLAVGFLAFYVFGYDKLVLKRSQNTFMSDNTKIHFLFNEDDMIIKATQNEKEISHECVSYNRVIRVQEDGDYIFMFISNVQAYIVDTKGMLEGSDLDLLKMFLKAKVKKYISNKKSTPIKL